MVVDAELAGCRPLEHRVGGLAPDADHRDLSAVLDVPQVRLHHGVDAGPEGQRVEIGLGRPADRPDTARPDRRLHHRGVPAQAVQVDGHPRRDDDGGHRQVAQVGEVPLVHVAEHERGRVHEAHGHRRRAHPLSERVDVVGVVPRAPQDDQVVVGPGHRGVVPDHPLGPRLALEERLREQALAAEPFRVVDRRRERDAGRDHVTSRAWAAGGRPRLATASRSRCAAAHPPPCRRAVTTAAPAGSPVGP